MTFETERARSARRRARALEAYRARKLVAEAGVEADAAELEDAGRRLFGDLQAEALADAVAAARKIQEDERARTHRYTPEELKMATETTRRIREIARRMWTEDPGLTYAEVYDALQEAGLEVSRSSFTGYHAPAVRRELGLIGTGSPGPRPAAAKVPPPVEDSDSDPPASAIGPTTAVDVDAEHAATMEEEIGPARRAGTLDPASSAELVPVNGASLERFLAAARTLQEGIRDPGPTLARVRQELAAARARMKDLETLLLVLESVTP